jgi:hypothetical protein
MNSQKIKAHLLWGVLCTILISCLSCSMQPLALGQILNAQNQTFGGLPKEPRQQIQAGLQCQGIQECLTRDCTDSSDCPCWVECEVPWVFEVQWAKPNLCHQTNLDGWTWVSKAEIALSPQAWLNPQEDQISAQGPGAREWKIQQLFLKPGVHHPTILHIAERDWEAMCKRP